MLDELDLQQVAPEVWRELTRAERPLLIFGAGVTAFSESARRLMEATGTPCVTTWGAAASFGDHPQWVGSFGTHGVTCANLAVQNADYILCLGSRLDTKATGAPPSGFAPKARLVMVDVDEAELAKMPQLGRPLYRAIRADIGDFLRHMPTSHTENRPRWVQQIGMWRDLYPPGPQIPNWHEDYKKPDAYRIIAEISDSALPTDTIVSDTGCCLAWAMQAWRWKKGQRFVHAFNQTPMGYGLPAAIGAAFATGGRVLLLTGDGGLSLCMAEMATLAHHGVPVHVFLFNNKGHAMCRQTQRQWLNSRYHGTGVADLATPDFVKVAAAYGVASFTEYEISPEQGVIPQVKYGDPLA